MSLKYQSVHAFISCEVNKMAKLATLITIQFLAIVNVLERKGIMTKDEYNKELQKLKEEA